MNKELDKYNIDVNKTLKILNKKGRVECIKYVSQELDISLEEAKELVLKYYEYDGKKYRINSRHEKDINPLIKYTIIAIIFIIFIWPDEAIILEMIFDPIGIKIIIFTILVFGGIIYFINYTPQVFMEGVTGLIFKNLSGLFLILVSIYLLIILFIPFQIIDNLIITILIIIFLGYLLVKGIRNVYSSIYDVISGNIIIYKGYIKVIKTGYIGTSISRFVVLKGDGNKKIPISNRRYKKIKNLKSGEIIYYGRTKVLIDIKNYII